MNVLGILGRRPPTDFELLRAIYDRHLDEFESKVATGQRASIILVPVDIPAIAVELGVDEHSVFGRLYYHLDPKYAPPKSPDETSRKVLFAPVAGTDRNCVNFPLLEAVLAGLWQQRRRDLAAVWTAALSLGIAVASLVVSLAH